MSIKKLHKKLQISSFPTIPKNKEKDKARLSSLGELCHTLNVC